ncbi:MAG: carbohydrate porin [Candidatus Omnitrophica bacterium]|jgi:carbohydrate-selective porin OprB|nr:carbohydrate porin [Candidatus Omnitrophota bacterium]
MFRKFVFCVILSIIIFGKAGELEASDLPEGIENNIIAKDLANLANGLAFLPLDQLSKQRDSLKNAYGTQVNLLFRYWNQVVLDGRNARGKDRSSWYYDLQIDQSLWKGGSIFLEVEGGRGAGLDKLIPNYSIFDDKNGKFSTLYIGRFYATQELCDGKLYFLGGRMDFSYIFDTNAVANTADLQFMSHALVNNNVIPFPQNGMGLVLGAKPFEWMYIDFGAANSNAKSTAIRMERAFKEPFLIAEIGITPKIGELEGAYRFNYWSTRKSLEKIDGAGTQNGDQGFGLSFDQALTQRLTVFARYGLADGHVRDLENFWSCGGDLKNPLPGRNYDVFGVAVAQSINGKDYSSVNANTGAETMFETYYKIALNKYFYLTPDLQVLLNPKMNKDNGTALVLGIKTLLLF